MYTMLIDDKLFYKGQVKPFKIHQISLLSFPEHDKILLPEIQFSLTIPHDHGTSYLFDLIEHHSPSITMMLQDKKILETISCHFDKLTGQKYFILDPPVVPNDEVLQMATYLIFANLVENIAKANDCH